MPVIHFFLKEGKMLRIPGITLINLALFAMAAKAEIAGLCNTGQTHVNPLGCTGQMVTPNPPGGGPNRDGNWELASFPLSNAPGRERPL